MTADIFAEFLQHSCSLPSFPPPLLPLQLRPTPSILAAISCSTQPLFHSAHTNAPWLTVIIPHFCLQPLLWPHLCQKYRQAENGQVIMDDLSLTSWSPSLWALPTALTVFPLCAIQCLNQTCFVFAKLSKKCLWHAWKCNHRKSFNSYLAWPAGVTSATSATSLPKKGSLGIRKLRCGRKYVGIVARWID